MMDLPASTCVAKFIAIGPLLTDLGLQQADTLKGSDPSDHFSKIDLELGPVLYSHGCGKTVPKKLGPKKNSKCPNS